MVIVYLLLVQVFNNASGKFRIQYIVGCQIDVHLSVHQTKFSFVLPMHREIRLSRLKYNDTVLVLVPPKGQALDIHGVRKHRQFSFDFCLSHPHKDLNSQGPHFAFGDFLGLVSHPALQRRLITSLAHGRFFSYLSTNELATQNIL